MKIYFNFSWDFILTHGLFIEKLFVCFFLIYMYLEFSGCLSLLLILEFSLLSLESINLCVYVLRSNQSILREINPEYSLEGLMLKLKLQYFGHLTRKANSMEKSLMLGKIEGRRRRGHQRMRWLDGITDTKDVNVGRLREMDGKGQGGRACCSPWSCKESNMTGQLNNSNNLHLNAISTVCS